MRHQDFSHSSPDRSGVRSRRLRTLLQARGADFPLGCAATRPGGRPPCNPAGVDTAVSQGKRAVRQLGRRDIELVVAHRPIFRSGVGIPDRGARPFRQAQTHGRAIIAARYRRTVAGGVARPRPVVPSAAAGQFHGRRKPPPPRQNCPHTAASGIGRRRCAGGTIPRRSRRRPPRPGSGLTSRSMAALPCKVNRVRPGFKARTRR